SIVSLNRKFVTELHYNLQKETKDEVALPTASVFDGSGFNAEGGTEGTSDMDESEG
ncbi:unnamed protein product, partial [Brassica napus]